MKSIVIKSRKKETDVNDIVHIEFTGLVKPREYVFGHEIRKILVGPEIIMLDI